MANFLKLIDFYPQSFSFTYKGNKSIKTVWGGIISLVTIIVITLNAKLIGKDIYLKEKPLGHFAEAFNGKCIQWKYIFSGK